MLKFLSKLVQDTRLYRQLLPPTIFLLIAVGSLNSSSFFLHYDTPTQDAAAIDFLHGCWGYSGHKPVIMFLLAIPNLLGGASPVWETILLVILGCVSAYAFAEIVNELLGLSTRWGILASMWFISLPAILYFTRIHLGYPLALFLLGILFHIRGRYGWAGLFFLMSVLSHAIMLIPTGFWIGWSIVLNGEFRKLRSLLTLAIGMLTPYVGMEIVRYLFLGEPFGWFQYIVFHEFFRQTDVLREINWSHMFEVIAASNGWLNLVFLIVGLAYPITRQRRQPVADIFYATALSMTALFVVRGMQDRLIFHRLWLGLYPLLAILTALVVSRGLTRLNLRSAGAAKALTFIVSLGVAASLFANALSAAQFSHSAYPQVERVMRRAAEESIPVRYFGNYHVAKFYAAAYGVEVEMNTDNISEILDNPGTVFIFEDIPFVDTNEFPRELETQINPPQQYEKHIYGGHYLWFKQYLLEQYVDTATLTRIQQENYSLDAIASATEIEVWWPTQAKASNIINLGEKGLRYYSGSGCLEKQPYGRGTKWWYEIILEKVGEMLSS